MLYAAILPLAILVVDSLLQTEPPARVPYGAPSVAAWVCRRPQPMFPNRRSVAIACSAANASWMYNRATHTTGFLNARPEFGYDLEEWLCLNLVKFL